ncbi:MAG TPA: hypothetical protein VFZ48_02520 [Candidatus Saccharimonadales bacterium]
MVFTPHQLADLLAVGFNWLNQEKPNTPRRAAMVFRALCRAGLMTEKQRKQIATNLDNVEVIWRQMVHVVQVDKKPGRADVRALREEDKRFVLLVMPQGKPDASRVLGANGYFFILTERGEDEAYELEAAYGSVIDKKRFMAAWSKAIEESGIQHGELERRQSRKNAARLKATEPTDIVVPPARVTEGDWDWND